MINSVLPIFFSGFFISLVFTLAAVLFFPRLKLLDFPERYGLKREKIPYPGGIIFCLLSILIIGLDWRFTALIIPILILGGISFWDDRKNLPIFPRFIIHFLAATAVFLAGIKITFIGDPIRETNIQLPFFTSYVATVLWILGIQHAMNWFDGLKGLCSGISGIGFLFLGILGIVRPELFFDPAEQSIFLANFLLAGIALGGWWYFFRGKILLGDTGAQVMGFLLAVMSIFSGAKIGTTLLILALPILDTGAVIFRRIFLEKKSPFKGDLRHLHHNLSRKIGEKKTVLLLLGISIILGIIAITLTGFSKLMAVGISTIFLGFFILWTHRSSF